MSAFNSGPGRSIELSLDTNSDMTPASSRRGSIDSHAKTISEDSSGPCQISLSISYITDAAYRSPRYDLSLNTPTSSGLIIYRAEFCNSTSETWKDTKVILSTSQTSFQGLGEPIPSMVPWHIRLNKVYGKNNDDGSGALVSTHEMQYNHKGTMAASNKASEPRNAMFGLGVSIKPTCSASASTTSILRATAATTSGLVSSPSPAGTPLWWVITANGGTIKRHRRSVWQRQQLFCRS